MKLKERSLWLLCIGLWLWVIALFLYSLLLQKINVWDHDWDLDSFLYIGSRLNRGELLYVHDFETKLPMLQYFFAIASRLGGIGAWRIMTFLIALVCSLFASYTLVSGYINRFNSITRSTLILSALFLLLLYSLPGSESSHIELIACSFALVSIVMIDAGARAIGKRTLFYFVAGLFLALAASIRPNYAYILPLYLMYPFIIKSAKNKKLYLLSSSTAMFSGFFVVILAMFSPYIFIPDGFDILKSGLIAIKNYSLHHPRFLGVIFHQFYNKYTFLFSSFLYLILAFSAKNMIVNIKEIRQKKVLSISLLACLCVLFIYISLWRTHYFAHNITMFLPYGMILFYFFVLSNRNKKSIIVISIIFSLIPLFYTGLYTKSILSGETIRNISINDRGIEPHIMQFLMKKQEEGIGFLVVDQPIYHAILGEKRIGDGHPAILDDILSGNNLGQVSNIILFSNEVQTNPSLAFLNSDKDIILIGKNYWLKESSERCLINSDYFSPVSIIGLESYDIFERNK